MHPVTECYHDIQAIQRLDIIGWRRLSRRRAGTGLTLGLHPRLSVVLRVRACSASRRRCSQAGRAVRCRIACSRQRSRCGSRGARRPDVSRSCSAICGEHTGRADGHIMLPGTTGKSYRGLTPGSDVHHAAYGRVAQTVSRALAQTTWRRHAARQQVAHTRVQHTGLYRRFAKKPWPTLDSTRAGGSPGQAEPA